MKNKLLFLFIVISTHCISQNQVVNIATESFYSEQNVVQSIDYDERNFRDVYPFDPGDYLTRGVEKLEANFYDKALTDFNESIQLFPECAICYYYRGINYIQLDSIEEAKSDFNKAIQYDPLLIEAYNDLGIIHLEQEQLDSAKYYLETGIEYYPAYPVTYHNLGYVELNRNKYNKAIKQFKKCVEIDSCHIQSFIALTVTYLYHKRNLNKAEDYLNKAIKCDSSMSEIHVWKAMLKAYVNRPKAAIQYMNDAINQNDSVYYYYAARAYLHIERKDYNLAINDFEKAYALNDINSENYQGEYSYKSKQQQYQPVLNQYVLDRISMKSSLRNHLNQVFCHLLAREHKLAKTQLDKLIKKDKKSPLIHLLLGMTEEHLNEYNTAAYNYDLAIELDDNYFEGYHRRGLLQLQSGKYREAIHDFNKMYSLDPLFVQALKYRGLARVKIGEYQLAASDLSFYYKTDTTDTDCLFNIGVCQSQLGLYEEAINTYEKVISDRKDDTGAYFEIVRNKYLSKDTLGALNICDTILSIRKCHVEVSNFKGIIYLEKQKYKEAISSFDYALECWPNYKEAYINRCIAYMNTNKYQNALFDINKVIEIEPNAGLAFYLRARIKSLTNDGSACADVNRALELSYQVPQSEIEKICIN